MDKAAENMLEQIDQYLNGELAADAKVLFEEKLAQDASLQALVGKSVAVREILADYKAQEFKQKFAHIAQQDRQNKRWTRASIVAALALASIGIGYVLFKNHDVAKSPTAIVVDTLKATQPSSTVSAQLQTPSPQKNRTIVSKTDTTSIAQAAKTKQPEQVVSVNPNMQEPSVSQKASNTATPMEIEAASLHPPANKTPQPFDCSHTIITFATVSQPSCKGQHTGQIALQGDPQGGKSPYVGHIERNGQTYRLGLDRLAEGSYTVIMKDNNGCSSQNTVTVASKTCVVSHEYSFDPHSGSSLELGIASTQTTLYIHNKAGLLQLQAQIPQGEAITWNGANNMGTVLPSGVYLYSITEGVELIEKGYITIVNTH